MKDVLTPLVPSYPALAWNPWSYSTFWNAYLQSRTPLFGGPTGVLPRRRCGKAAA